MIPFWGNREHKSEDLIITFKNQFLKIGTFQCFLKTDIFNSAWLCLPWQTHVDSCNGQFHPYPYLWQICQNVIPPCVYEGINNYKFLFPSHYIALLLFKGWHGNCREMENNQSSEENRRPTLTAEGKGGIYNVCFISHFLFEWRNVTTQFSVIKAVAFHRDDC